MQDPRSAPWRRRGAAAQPAAAFPGRPTALVVPFLAGGSTDMAARILAEHMPMVPVVPA